MYPGTLGFDPVVGNSWIHLVCRYNAQNGELTIFAGGVARGRNVDTVHGMKTGPGPFMLGCNENGYCAFIGDMDEVFFTPSALADYDVNRIYACGIDGSRCRCSSSSYYYCGFANPLCSNLPLCSSTTP
jgi:hypothetical protein